MTNDGAGPFSGIVWAQGSTNMAKRAARPSVLSEGFGAFVLDQLSGLEGIEAKPMFGGAGFSLDGSFFGDSCTRNTSISSFGRDDGEYKKRRAKPFEPSRP